MECLNVLRRIEITTALLMLSLNADAKQLDTGAIDDAIGMAGQPQGEVYKISLARTDLSISIDDISVKPRLALNSWIAFKAHGDVAVTHGDLVLKEDEVGPVLRMLEQHGITITALHNHLIRETPKVMYLHFWGEGDAEELAAHLRRALILTKTPFTKSNGAEKSQDKTENEFPAQRIQEVLGEKGILKDGVLSISVPRQQAITMHNMDLPASMGMATALNFQAAGVSQVAATGDFVLMAPEVSRVASALVRHGIQITALHNHLIHSTPELYFMHFWAHDSTERVVEGLRAALDAMKGAQP